MVQMRANPEGKKIFRVKSVNGRGKVTIEEEKGGATEAVPGRALFRRLATPPYLTTKLIASLFPSNRVPVSVLFPVSVLGTFVGVELIINGATWSVSAVGVRNRLSRLPIR
jgi:hypothetical protein